MNSKGSVSSASLPLLPPFWKSIGKLVLITTTTWNWSSTKTPSRVKDLQKPFQSKTLPKNIEQILFQKYKELILIRFLTSPRPIWKWITHTNNKAIWKNPINNFFFNMNYFKFICLMILTLLHSFIRYCIYESTTSLGNTLELFCSQLLYFPYSLSRSGSLV